MSRVENVAYTPSQRVFFEQKAPKFEKSGIWRDSVPRMKPCLEPRTMRDSQ